MSTYQIENPKLDSLARLYIEKRKIRKQAQELNRASLARKFEVSETVIYKILKNQPVRNVSDEDKALIRACNAEHQRMLKQSRGSGIQVMAKKAGVCRYSLEAAVSIIEARAGL